MSVVYTPPTPAGESASGSPTPRNTPTNATVPFPALPTPALEVDNSAGTEGLTRIGEQNFDFPTHHNGHFPDFTHHTGHPSALPHGLGSGLFSDWQQSSAPFTNCHNNSGDPTYSASMPAFSYPASFDATPHHIHQNFPGHVRFPPGPAYSSSVGHRVSPFFRYGYDASGLNLLINSASGNFDLSHNFDQPNMMPQSASGFGQPTFGHSAPQQFGQGYGNGGNNFGFVNSRSSLGQSYPANSMPHNSYTDSMNNMNNNGLGRTAGFLESGISGNATFGSTHAPPTPYSFGPSSPPPVIDLTRFAWPSSNPVIKVTNVSTLFPYL